MKLQLQNFIPKYQQSNQNIANIREILESLPALPNETDVYTHIRTMIWQKPHMIRLDVKNGVHTREGDSWHFNMSVYDKRSRLHTHVQYRPCVRRAKHDCRLQREPRRMVVHRPITRHHWLIII